MCTKTCAEEELANLWFTFLKDHDRLMYDTDPATHQGHILDCAAPGDSDDALQAQRPKTLNPKSPKHGASRPKVELLLGIHVDVTLICGNAARHQNQTLFELSNGTPTRLARCSGVAIMNNHQEKARQRPCPSCLVHASSQLQDFGF
jgi:hypothetical protein